MMMMNERKKENNIGHVRIQQNFTSLLRIDISFVQVCLGLYQKRTFDVYRCLLFSHGKKHEIVRNRGKFSIFCSQSRFFVFSLSVSHDTVFKGELQARVPGDSLVLNKN